MPDASAPPAADAGATADALFVELVLQQSNLALMALGRVPHPQTGESLRDLDTAQHLIDQLAMLERKTRGNLSAAEAELLQRTLMTLRLTFVEAVEAAPTTSPEPPAESKTASATPAPETTGSDDSSESRKKFVKKY